MTLLVKYADLDRELFALLQTPQSRTELTTILMQAWFADRGGEIAELFEDEEFEAVQQLLYNSGGAT